MVDYLSEIPLPGRLIVPPAARLGTASKSTSLGFIAGPENRLVASAITRLMRASSAQNALAPGLLALFGPSGTGKTHLAQGLVRHWTDSRGEHSALYLTAVDFYRQLLDAIKRHTVGEFRSGIRAHELLAIDDLHQLPSQKHVHHELRFTLDAYEESGGKLIVTSPRAAHTLANLSSDLQSRLSAGLVLQLAPPGSNARTQMIRRIADALGQPLSEKAAVDLAAAVHGTANDLFGAVFELSASSTKHPNRQSDAAARTARRPPLQKILSLVARYYRLPQAQLKSGSRRKSIVFARSMVIYLGREVAAATYDQLGRLLGGRDHTTIIHNYRKIDRDRSRDPVIQEAIDELKQTIMSSYARFHKVSTAC